MRRTTWTGIAAALAIGLVMTTGGCKDEQKNTSTAATPSAKSDTAGGANTSASAGKPGVCNAKCPVAGDPVDPGVQTVDYDGKTWGFCCDSCVAPFKKDPAKYATKYEKEHPDQK